MHSFLYLLATAALLGWSFLPDNFFGKTAMVEECANGLDDDDDGLIDLNDPDCDCPEAGPVSLIPNPSFEDTLCCPSHRSQLNCANGWIQASEATTDLLHTCGWMGWDDLPPPLPFPDGNACVGWRNGRPGSPNEPGSNPNWKEYAGACLLSPLKAGVKYKFEFDVGFTKQPASPPTTLVFFGTPHCINLPFGEGNDNFGCPTNGFGWVNMGSVAINGTFQWKKYSITVTPNQDINAIAIGPSCQQVEYPFSPYYFFDNLVLAIEEDFNFNISASGHPCSGAIDLTMPYRDSLQYQWYRNGIALPGQTSAQLKGVTEEGDYQVRLLGPYSCHISKTYRHYIPFFGATLNTYTCEGEPYFFHQENLRSPGTYYDTLKTADNCDSIVQLNLSVEPVKNDTLSVKIFEGERFEMGGQLYATPGEFDGLLSSYLGCDSLVHLYLDFYKIFIPSAFSPNGDGFNDVFTIFAGADVKEVLELKVFNRWGGLAYSSTGLGAGNPPNTASKNSPGWDGTTGGKAADTGVYTYMARVLFDDGKDRLLKGSVVLLR
jgi:gliding motility-associated-like protein